MPFQNIRGGAILLAILTLNRPYSMKCFNVMFYAMLVSRLKGTNMAFKIFRSISIFTDYFMSSNLILRNQTNAVFTISHFVHEHVTFFTWTFILFLTNMTHIFKLTFKSFHRSVIKLLPVHLMHKPLGFQRHHDLHSRLDIGDVGVMSPQLGVGADVDDGVSDVKILVKVADHVAPASVSDKEGPWLGDCTQSIRGCLTINNAVKQRKVRVKR